MRSPILASTILSLASLFALASCGPPKNYTPADQVPKLPTLKEVMDVQATAADPQFKKMDDASHGDDDFAQFADTATKIDATSKHIKDFSKGPEFDAFADQLNAKAALLAKAAAAKDAAGANAALQDMKATCKACHSQFR